MTDRICSIDGCGKPIKARGWCSMHNARYDRHGTPTARRQSDPKWEWLVLVVTEPTRTGCRDWPWTPGTQYPQLWFDGKVWRVSHLALVMDGRPRPPAPGNHSLHSCDRKVCVAPWHLRWGTNAENVRDRRRPPVADRAHV